jgi:hypothetical protein
VGPVGPVVEVVARQPQRMRDTYLQILVAVVAREHLQTAAVVDISVLRRQLAVADPDDEVAAAGTAGNVGIVAADDGWISAEGPITHSRWGLAPTRPLAHLYTSGHLSPPLRFRWYQLRLLHQHSSWLQFFLFSELCVCVCMCAFLCVCNFLCLCFECAV